jgi:Skp family chaperone for outer membrane proteins
MNSALKKTIFVLFALLLLASPAVHARGRGNPTGAPGSRFATEHPRRNQVNKRVDNQRARINEGVKNGELSKGQARQLRANDRAIKAQEHAEVKANGGHLTKAEQRQLNQEENANSKLIHDEKHPAGK